MKYYFNDLVTYLNTDNIEIITLLLLISYSSSLDMLTLYTTNQYNIVNFYLTLQTNDYFNISPINDTSNYSFIQLSILNADNKYIGLFNQDLANAYIDVGVRREDLYKYYLTVPVNYITYNNVDYLVIDYLPYYSINGFPYSVLYDSQALSGYGYKVYSSYHAIPFASQSIGAGSYGVGEGLYQVSSNSSRTYFINDVNFNNFDISAGRLYRGFGGYVQPGIGNMGPYSTDMIQINFDRISRYYPGMWLDGVVATFANGDTRYDNYLGLHVSLEQFDFKPFARPTSTPGVYDVYTYSLVNSTSSVFNFLNSFKDTNSILNVFNLPNTSMIYDSIVNSSYANDVFYGRFSSYNLFSPLSGFGSMYFSNPFMNLWGRSLIDESQFKPSFGDNYIESSIFVNQNYENIDYDNVDFKMSLAVVPVRSVPQFTLSTLVDFSNSFNGFLELNFLNVSVLSILCLFLGISFISLIRGLF